MLSNVCDNMLFSILYKMTIPELLHMRQTCSCIDSFVEHRKDTFSQRNLIGINLIVTVDPNTPHEFTITWDNRNSPTIFHSYEDAAFFEKRLSAISINKISVDFTTFSPKVIPKLKKLCLSCQNLDFPPSCWKEHVTDFVDAFSVTKDIFFNCSQIFQPIALMLHLRKHPKREKFDVRFNELSEIDSLHPVFEIVRMFNSFRIKDTNGRILADHLNQTLRDIYQSKNRCNLRSLIFSFKLDKTSLFYKFPYVDPGAYVPPLRKVWDILSMVFVKNLPVDRIYVIDNQCHSVIITEKIEAETVMNQIFLKVEIQFTDKNPTAVLDLILRILKIRKFTEVEKKKFTETDSMTKESMLNFALIRQTDYPAREE